MRLKVLALFDGQKVAAIIAPYTAKMGGMFWISRGMIMVVSEGFINNQNRPAPIVSEAIIIRVIGTSKVLNLLFTM